MIESANVLELRRIHLSPLRIGSLPFRAMTEVCPVNRAACLFAAQSHGMTIAALLYQYPARASTDRHMVPGMVSKGCAVHQATEIFELGSDCEL
jgi:hypothetical protein